MARKGGPLLHPKVGDYVGVQIPPPLQSSGITHLPGRVLQVLANGYVVVMTSAGQLKEAVNQTQACAFVALSILFCLLVLFV